MATHSSILAWRFLWTEEPGRLQSTGSQESDMTEQVNHHHSGLFAPGKVSKSTTIKQIIHVANTRECHIRMSKKTTWGAVAVGRWGL